MSEIRPNTPRIALVGFGEAAQAFFSGWSEGDTGRVRAFDIKATGPAEAGAMLATYRATGVDGTRRLSDAFHGAGLVFSVVTADRALEAAKAAAGEIDKGAIWLDCNSCAPGTKRAAADVIETAGGRYVDVAVMAPVNPARHRAPCCLRRDAAAAEELLKALDMRPTIAGDRVGDASSIKMIRSVMIKGMEALTAECLLAARHAGVEQAVLASLQASDPGFDWEARSAYNLERMIVHGARRAAEMREVAATLAELGLPRPHGSRHHRMAAPGRRDGPGGRRARPPGSRRPHPCAVMIARNLRHRRSGSRNSQSANPFPDWNRCPARSSASSSKLRPISCRLIGRPACEKPQGRLSVGDPVRFVG